MLAIASTGTHVGAVLPTVCTVDDRSDKTCASCGRRVRWRRKWADHWDSVRYCSDACRRRKVRPVDRALEDLTLELLRARRRGATICPSEVARAHAGDRSARSDDEPWRELMEPARAAARRLTADGRVEITQRGVVVDPSTAKGPIRIRLRDER